MKKFFIFFFIIISIFGYFVHKYTNTLETTHHRINLRKYEKKLIIAHVSDLHTSGLGAIEKQVIDTINNNNIDIIVITGDIATPNGTLEGYKSVLKNLKAPKGVYYVPGNWEYWEPIHELQLILKENNIIDLTNKTHKIDDNLWLVGLDDSEEGNPYIDIVSDIPSSDIKIGLFHSPQFFDNVFTYTDLNLAGHSHGGQIRIPFIGPFFLPTGTGKYDQGWFEKEKSKLFVSRGIGTSILPIRFFCSPELAIIEIYY